MKLAEPVEKFWALTIRPLQKLLPAVLTLVAFPVTCGAAAGFHSAGSKFVSKPFLSQGGP